MVKEVVQGTPVSKEKMEKEWQKGQKRKERYEQRLKAHSKSLQELVVSEDFIVEDVLSENQAHSVSPHLIIGGPSPSYKAGFSSRLTLKVRSISPATISYVNTLYFDGFSAVKAGDVITAKIPRYEEKENYHARGSFLDNGGSYYFNRRFKPEEKAIELAIFSDNKLLRTDRAVDYKEFCKE